MNTGIEKKLVPYELAKKLFDNGFNETCMMFYTGKKELRFICNTNDCFQVNQNNQEYSAPSYQQTLEWIAIKHKVNPTINKADREFLLNSMRKLIQEVNSNVPFVSQQFNESMEKTISQAKNEIETFVTNRITALGIDAVKDNPSLFLSGLNTENKNIGTK